MKRIELSKFVGDDIRVLIGHERGIAVRNAFGMDALDQDPEVVQIAVPSTLRTLTPSFVQGLVAESIHRLGEKGFYDHYQFDAEAHVIGDIRAGVDRVLTNEARHYQKILGERRRAG